MIDIDDRVFLKTTTSTKNLELGQPAHKLPYGKRVVSSICWKERRKQSKCTSWERHQPWKRLSPPPVWPQKTVGCRADPPLKISTAGQSHVEVSSPDTLDPSHSGPSRSKPAFRIGFGNRQGADAIKKARESNVLRRQPLIPPWQLHSGMSYMDPLERHPR